MESLNIEKSIGNVAAVAAEDPRPPFESTRAERWGALGSAVVGYIYVLSIFSEHWRVWIVAFAALLCGGVALALRDERPKRECWVWLGCLWTCLLGGVFGVGTVICAFLVGPVADVFLPRNEKWIKAFLHKALREKVMENIG